MCESAGNLWIKTLDAFEKSGISIVLANPMKARVVTARVMQSRKIEGCGE